MNKKYCKHCQHLTDGICLLVLKEIVGELGQQLNRRVISSSIEAEDFIRPEACPFKLEMILDDSEE